MYTAAHHDIPQHRRIFLRNHITPVYIGVYANEQHAQQRMRFNIDIYVPLANCTPQNDQLDEVVDYDIMQQAIAQHTQTGHIALQETLCDAIAQQLLQHPSIHAVRVATEKLDVYENSEAVGVEVFLRRSDASS